MDALTPLALEPSSSTRRAETVLVPLLELDAPPLALALALRLVQERGGRVVLLHAVHLSVVGEERGIPRARLLADLRLETEQTLARIVESCGASARVEIVVEAGRPDEVMAVQARRRQASLLVLQVPARPRWLRWWPHRIARFALTHAPCPVCLLTANPTDPVYTLVVRNPTKPSPPSASPTRYESTSLSRSLFRVLASK